MNKGLQINLGLIGFPVEHSLSPQLHNAALRALGLRGEYRLYPVPILPNGEAKLKGIVDKMRRGDIDGLNVTIPHKQSVISLLDDLTRTARDIGAVNTIVYHKGRLLGDNTDTPGFLNALNSFLDLNLQPEANSFQSVLLLGAGGSARAVAYALAQAGWKVVVAARRLEQAQKLAHHLNQCFTDFSQPHADLHPIAPMPLTPDTLAQTSANLIVNATPVGMYPHIAFSPWMEEVSFPSHAAVFDLVYNPQETSLVRQAHNQGLPATNGLGMLVEQAALSFELWTRLPAPRSIMYTALDQNGESANRDDKNLGHRTRSK